MLCVGQLPLILVETVVEKKKLHPFIVYQSKYERKLNEYYVVLLGISFML